MIIRILAVISFALVFFLQSDVSFAEEIEIDIKGEVVNLTQGVGVGEMVSVALHVSSLDSPRQTQHTFTDSSSSFQFESVLYSPDNLYGLSTIYKGTVYVGDIVIESGSANSPPYPSTTHPLMTILSFCQKALFRSLALIV